MKLFSPTPIRRYTPPTCTLEIWGKSSALSFWSDRPLIKELDFELRFDDPRVADDKQVIVKGDREKLIQLYEAVTTYVQNTLLQRSLQIPVGIETLALPSSTTDVENSSHAHLALTSREDTAIVAFPKAPTLKSIGLLSHELDFGSLAQDASHSSIQLSVSQLFDLAEALEQFSAEMDILPSLNKVKKRKATVIWASTAAAAILAVGISTVGVKLYQVASEKNNIATSQGGANSQTARSNIQDVVPPSPPPPPSPVPSPTLPPALARDTLPPPPSVPEPIPPNRRSVPPVVLPPPSLPSAPQQTTIAVVPESSGNAKSSSIKRTTLPPRDASAPPKKPDLPALPPLQANSPVAENPGEASSAQAPTTLRIAPSQENSENASPANVPNTTALAPSPQERATNNLLDTIPQVAEVREYFQERWQVPKGLNQRLEYRLVLNKEGSIARISPLGRAANVYLDRTQMPLMGDPFVSPLEVANNATIRLVLNPDGSVKTFLEE
jgi:hypothetical protein